ncbi:hypothetical protein CsSME_00010335 [Camellia sinensis var. sinensis]
MARVGSDKAICNEAMVLFAMGRQRAEQSCDGELGKKLVHDGGRVGLRWWSELWVGRVGNVVVGGEVPEDGS